MEYQVDRADECQTRVVYTCWPGGITFFGAGLMAIGIALLLTELEVFSVDPEVAWGVVLLGFGLFTLLWGIFRGDY